MSRSRKNYDWIIHYVANGFCEDCGEYHRDMKDGMCDAHTHGLARYGSKEIQFVLDYGPELVGGILNDVGEKIREGLILHDGDMLEGFTDDGAKIKVVEMPDCFGEPVFRLIMPDGKFRMPEDSDEFPYNKQYEDPYLYEHKEEK